MKVEILLRTHDKRQVHCNNRNVEGSKTEVLFRCVNSLMKSIDSCNRSIVLKVIDDHSEPETLEILTKIIDGRGEIIPLEGHGNNASLLKQYKRAKESEAELVYLVEDDYLHQTYALQEFVEVYDDFCESAGALVCIHPSDDTDNYKPHWVKPTLVVPGKRCLWRLNEHTTGTLLMSPKIMNDNWAAFNKLATFYGKDLNVTEDSCWHTIWKTKVPLLTPLHPLTYHLNEHTHPIFNHLPLWEENKI